MKKKQQHRASNYFEATIQLRPKSPVLLEFVVNEVEKRKDVFISEVKTCKTGFDVLISSQRFARSLGKKMKDRFKGELKVTKTLFSRDRQSSKTLYRATVLFRLEE
tara:strand:+ start:32398 stop:32715 length:318 start_codon:yes stop_codon:yes gene_type:complete